MVDEQDHLTSQDPTLAWIEAFLATYRPLGFLQKADDVSDRDLATEIMEYDDSFFERFPGVDVVLDDLDDFESFFSPDELKKMPGSSALMEIRVLAALDPDRIWWAYRSWDFERGWTEEDTVGDFKNLLESLASISMGTFQPRDIEEQPTGNGAQIELTLAGERHVLRSRYEHRTILLHEDAEEEGVLAPSLELVQDLNVLIRSSGRTYHVLDLLDEEDEESYFSSTYLVCLTDQERATLTRRGWPLG